MQNIDHYKTKYCFRKKSIWISKLLANLVEELDIKAMETFRNYNYYENLVSKKIDYGLSYPEHKEDYKLFFFTVEYTFFEAKKDPFGELENDISLCIMMRYFFKEKITELSATILSDHIEIEYPKDKFSTEKQVKQFSKKIEIDFINSLIQYINSTSFSP